MTWQLVQFGFGVFSSLLCSVALVVVLWDSYKAVIGTRQQTLHTTSHYETRESQPSKSPIGSPTTPLKKGSETIKAGYELLKRGSVYMSTILVLTLMTGCVTSTDVHVQDSVICVTTDLEGQYVPK